MAARCWFPYACAALLTISLPGTARPGDVGIAVPDGFEVSLFAGDELAHDIYSMTVDAHGRVVVAGPGYVKRLEDADGDGRADRAVLFSAVPASGAHGMVFDGDDLICTGDNSLMRIRDTDGDGLADGEPAVWTHLRHPEHGANGVVRGPDGWYYVICGNDAGVSTEHAAGASPVKHPRCGGAVRISPDGRTSEVYAHGMRNPYDLDFDRHGSLLTVDADGERDHHLPWYAATRLFDVAQGAEHGWLLTGWTRSWNRPESYFDNVERLVEIGRGSPTGLLVYRHRSFPPRYRQGVFSACWTLGRVYYFPLARSGASFTAPREIFMQTTGDTGFAPVDLAVLPDGDLLVAIGGRRTRGSVFRVSYAAGKEQRDDNEHATPLQSVLAADQPLCSWSRAAWMPVARQLGRQAFIDAVLDNDRDLWQRVRAVAVATELFDGLPMDVARQAASSNQPELTARIAWSVGRTGDDRAAQELLSSLSFHPDPRVKRAAWEGLAGMPAVEAELSPAPDWNAIAAKTDRRVRRAMLLAAAGTCQASFERFWRQADQATRDQPRAVLFNYARRCLDGPPASPEAAAEQLTAAGEVLLVSSEPEIALEAVRLMQLALGDLRIRPGEPDVYSGYVGNATDRVNKELRQQVAHSIAPRFPTADDELNRELARLLGMLEAGTDGLPAVIASRFTDTSPPEDDVHYLIVLSRLHGERSAEVTRHTARALTGLHHKLAADHKYPSRNWPLRVGEAFAELCLRDASLAAAVVDHPRFGLAEHSMFADEMPKPERMRAARRLLAAADASDDGEGWSAALVRLVSELPDQEVLPSLRAKWNNHALRDAIALVLARRRMVHDHIRLVEALASPQSSVVSAAAEALVSFEQDPAPADIGRALVTLRRYCQAPDERGTRSALAKLLRHWTAQPLEADESTVGAENLAAVYQPWFDWFAAAHAEQASALAGLVGMDAAAWRERLAAVDWTAGDALRGNGVFEKRTCHRCHRGSQRLGPDLTGAAGRLAREDLFAAVIDPHRDVSPLYQTTLVTTHSGRVFHGLVVYESPESTLLQTGPDTTVRITGGDLDTMQTSRQSLMPTGLLDDATDQELADLYQYLRSLTPP